jgi:hypothetical protein
MSILSLLDNATLRITRTPDNRLLVNQSATVLEVMMAEDGLVYILDSVLIPIQASPLLPLPASTEEVFATIAPPSATQEVSGEDDNSGRGRGRGRGGDDDIDNSGSGSSNED